MVGLLRAEGLFQSTHNMDTRDEENSGRNIFFFNSFFIDGIASSGSILDFVPLNNTSFEHLASLFPWV